MGARPSPGRSIGDELPKTAPVSNLMLHPPAIDPASEPLEPTNSRQVPLGLVPVNVDSDSGNGSPGAGRGAGGKTASPNSNMGWFVGRNVPGVNGCHKGSDAAASSSKVSVRSFTGFVPPQSAMTIAYRSPGPSRTTSR